MVSEDRLKRAMDLVGAAGGLVLLSVPIVIIGFLVWIKMGRPVLFRHRRPGLNGRPFTLLKFRTMSDKHGAGGTL